jgi:hypothetical protein
MVRIALSSVLYCPIRTLLPVRRVIVAGRHVIEIRS